MVRRTQYDFSNYEEEVVESKSHLAYEAHTEFHGYCRTPDGSIETDCTDRKRAVSDYARCRTQEA